MDALITYLENPDTPLGLADLIWIGYLLYGFIRGTFRGLPRELAGLLGTGVSLYCGWKFYGPVSAFIRSHTRLESETGSSLLAYLLLLLSFFLAWKLITLALKKTLDWTCPSQLQQWGGGVLGITKALIILTVILTAVNLSGFENARTPLIRRSWFGRTTQQVVPVFLHDTFPALFPEPVQDSIEELEIPPESQPEPQPEPEQETDGSGNP
jgi:membrane protein required for colicin V production